MKMKIQMFFILIGFVGVTLFYNNCSPKHSDQNLSSVAYTSCEGLDELTLFSNTYHPFLKSKCSSCHYGGGAGPGEFASSGSFQAWNSFNTIGPSLINERALDGHSSGSGLQNKDSIDRISAEYLTGLETLKNCELNENSEINENQISKDRIRTVSKGINPQQGQSRTITWNLSTDTIEKAGFDPNLFKNAKLSINIGIFEPTGKVVYVISNPMISTTSVDIHIESLLVLINGKAQDAQRAFYFVNANIRQWNSTHPYFGDEDARIMNDQITDGSMIFEGEIRTTDTISVSIGKLETTILPPPEQFPEVSLSSTSTSLLREDTIDSSGKIVAVETAKVDVVLSKPWDEVTSVDLTFGSDMTSQDECCVIVRNDDGENIAVNNFDRDFELVNNLGQNTSEGRLAYASDSQASKLRIVFSPGEIKKSLYLKIVPDHRNESDEMIHLAIGNRNKLIAKSSGQEIKIQIPDNDPLYTGNAMTFTQLMSPGGLLNKECLRCHNSVDNRGGYDLTNYWQMIDESILIPKNANSMMFRRMDPDNPVYDGNFNQLPPMPESGFIPYEPLRDLVKDWILEGAKNN